MNDDLSGFNVTNITNTFDKTFREDSARNVPLEVSLISTIITNIVTCPLTVLLNVLVIMAVKRRPRLQSYTNILLACLAGTDVLTGLTVQPSFIVWKMYQFLGEKNNDMITDFHNSSLRFVGVCSILHLALVTCERLIAIKFSADYPYIVTKRNIKKAVIGLWVFVLSLNVLFGQGTYENIFLSQLRRLLVAFILISCVLFVSSAYAILYFVTLRHRKMIKTQQLPQEEVERFSKENKALKTTVFLVGAVLLCFLPAAFFLLLTVSNGIQIGQYTHILPWIRTFGMLNSLLNPLIYCWRQKEMRKLVLRFKMQAVDHENH